MFPLVKSIEHQILRNTSDKHNMEWLLLLVCDLYSILYDILPITFAIL